VDRKGKLQGKMYVVISSLCKYAKFPLFFFGFTFPELWHILASQVQKKTKQKKKANKKNLKKFRAGYLFREFLVLFIQIVHFPSERLCCRLFILLVIQVPAMVKNKQQKKTTKKQQKQQKKQKKNKKKKKKKKKKERCPLPRSLYYRKAKDTLHHIIVVN
jgi:uncharacterized metal-binding protein